MQHQSHPNMVAPEANVETAMEMPDFHSDTHSNSTQGKTSLPPAMTLSDNDYASLRSTGGEDEAAECESNPSDEDSDFCRAMGIPRQGTENFGDFLSPPPPPEFGRSNIFQTSHAGRPVGLQGPAHKARELGLQWLTVLKNLEQASQAETDGWSEKIQMQKYHMEDLQQQQRQEMIDRETERSKMGRTDHRHALQQLVVEAFRWRRASPSFDREDDGRPTAPSHNASITSPTMKTAGPSTESIESLCGLTVEDDDYPTSGEPSSPSGAAATTVLVPIASNSSIAAPPPPAPPAPESIISMASSTSSTLSACNRQKWKSQFPLPAHVPPRELADHTSNPLDVSDRAMLSGVLDDIDSVMTTSDLGEDGMLKDRYSEVLANLQFLGLYRPKYADGVSEDDEDDDTASMRNIDVGLMEDLDGDVGDFFSNSATDSNGIVEILDA